MTIPNRTVTLTGVFAEDASTTIPGSPVSGASYRNTAMTSTVVGKGWPFKTIVDSANFNQAMFEYSSVTSQVEKYGFLPWSNLTNYVKGSVCLGSDGTLYRAKQATGPASTVKDPTQDSTDTYWEDYITTTVNATMASYVGTILSTLYPVGSIYITTRTSNPMATLIPGSTWSLVSSGKALWTGNGSNGNSTIAAGLPNITGKIKGDDFTKGMSGAFKSTTGSLSGYGTESVSGSQGKNIIDFNASRSSSIYGSSTTVQPPAYVVNVWRRTA